jgi:hypothetical protein
MTLDRLELTALAYIVRNMRERDREEIFATRHSADMDEFVLHIFNQRYTGVAAIGYADDHTPVAAYGIYQAWGGVHWMWMFATDRWPEVMLGMTRYAKRQAIPHAFKHGMTLGQCFSLAGYDQIHRWIRMLGGVEDCRLTKWGKNGEDFVRFIWKRNP